MQHVWLLCLLSFFLFLSTIHGRIDQVNQLLELDYQKRGGARYTALDKWTNQLNSLNQAIVSKLTWWHVNSRDKENGMFKHIHKVCYCASSSKSSETRCTAQLLRMPPLISRRLQEPQERVQSVLCCRDERKSPTLFFVFRVPDWQILPCATHKCFSCLKKVQMCMKTCTQYFNVYCCLLVINGFLSALKGFNCLWLATVLTLWLAGRSWIKHFNCHNEDK